MAIRKCLSIRGDMLLNVIWNWEDESNTSNNERRELGTQSQIVKLNCDTQNSWKSGNHGLGEFAKVKGGWHVAEPLRNIIPLLLAMLKPCEAFNNKLPLHFRWNNCRVT